MKTGNNLPSLRKSLKFQRIGVGKKRKAKNFCFFLCIFFQNPARHKCILVMARDKARFDFLYKTCYSNSRVIQ